MTDLVIRAATLDDVPTIVDFNLRLAEETEETVLDARIVQDGVRTLLSEPARGRYDVACVAGAVVGQIMHTREWSDWRNGDIWWIQSVFVHPDHRRRGVFRRLYEHVRQQADVEPGVVGLRLYVENSNESAQTTYRRLGMTATGYRVMQELL